jgi:uncharacterized protein YbjT (DUF2867 family)
MKVIIFGATGMVGQGVLRECLLAPDVELVTTVGRTPAPNPVAGPQPERWRQIVHSDLSNLVGLRTELAGFDACFFPLGVSSSGMTEADYDRITYGLTLSAAETLSSLSPGMTFIYVSGAGTDSTEKGRSMWARVKGRTENALLRLPLEAYMFRPGFIEPMDGIQSKTPSYRILYKVLTPLMPVVRWALRQQILNTRQIGLAMLSVAKLGYEKRILEIKDIRIAAGR